MYPLYKMKENITDGTEYLTCITDPSEKEKIKQELKDAETKIGHLKCEYCGKDIISIWDKYNNSNWWPYLGNQARKPRTYNYSPIIRLLRRYFEVEGLVWDEAHGNNLINVHARAHSNPTNWAVRASSASIRLLCPACFQKTYNRTQIQGDDGILYAITVLRERGETVESVMKDLGISGKILGKGAIHEY